MTVTDTPTILDDERITQFGLLVEANRRLNRVIESSLRANHGMTLIEFEAMVRLGRSPQHQMSMTDLATQMVLTSGGVTRLVDRLAKKGLVVRVSCPSDRRVQWAQLTESGVAKITTAVATHLDDLDAHFFAAMSPDEADVVMPVLDRLRAACSEHE